MGSRRNRREAKQKALKHAQNVANNQAKKANMPISEPVSSVGYQEEDPLALIFADIDTDETVSSTPSVRKDRYTSDPLNSDDLMMGEIDGYGESRKRWRGGMPWDDDEGSLDQFAIANETVGSPKPAPIERELEPMPDQGTAWKRLDAELEDSALSSSRETINRPHKDLLAMLDADMRGEQWIPPEKQSPVNASIPAADVLNSDELMAEIIDGNQNPGQAGQKVPNAYRAKMNEIAGNINGYNATKSNTPFFKAIKEKIGLGNDDSIQSIADLNKKQFRQYNRAARRELRQMNKQYKWASQIEAGAELMGDAGVKIAETGLSSGTYAADGVVNEAALKSTAKAMSKAERRFLKNERAMQKALGGTDLGNAVDIAGFKAGQGSGITDFITHHPLGTAMMVVAGVSLFKRLKDDDND